MTAQRDIRLFLADVDGALLTREKVLTEAARAAVRDLHAAGIAFAITSGRPPRGMSMLIEPLALTGPVAGFNGGVFVNPDLSVIQSHTLEPAAARETLALILERGLDAWLYTETEWLIRDKQAAHVAREAWTVKFEARQVREFTEEHLAHAVKIVGVSDDLEAVALCEQAARKALGERVSAARSQPYYLDVTHPRANKGEVVLMLARHSGIAPAQIATMGDMPNDVLMFRKSGFSIAMGNASDEVKAQASAVTDSNEHEGFANAVRRFILPSVIEVSEDDLPVFCPNPHMPLWSWHPRVYLDVVHESEAMCPYCGTRYRLRRRLAPQGLAPSTLLSDREPQQT